MILLILGRDFAYEAHYICGHNEQNPIQIIPIKDEIIARSRGIGGKGNFHFPALPFSLPGLQSSALIDVFYLLASFPSAPKAMPITYGDCDLAEDLGSKFSKLQVFLNLQ